MTKVGAERLNWGRSDVRRALEAAGVEFIDENGGGPGVWLRKQPSAKK